MKVLLINTSERTGGAALAASRLMDALNHNGVQCKMLVRDRQSYRSTVALLPDSPLHRLYFLWERFVVWCANGFRKQGIFGVDIANAGTDVTCLPEFREADVIHLHWVNQGFLSLNGLQKILRSGKPVVWTLHDMWPFTAICHYADTCNKYVTACHHCPQLHGVSPLGDMASRVFIRKRRLLDTASNLHFVACSKWLQSLASRSRLAGNHPVFSIPNAINTTLFRSGTPEKGRWIFQFPADRKLLLFGAQKVTDERKGITFLAEALKILAQKNPPLAATIDVVVIGGKADTLRDLFSHYPLHAVGYLSEESRIATLYQAVDAYVSPSLQDNLPNTIVEATACGIPCIAFGVGGIPEMIAHRRTGYVATPRDAADLAEGIAFVLADEERRRQLGREAAQYAKQTYAEHVVAMQHIQLYNQISTQTNA